MELNNFKIEEVITKTNGHKTIYANFAYEGKRIGVTVTKYNDNTIYLHSDDIQEENAGVWTETSVSEYEYDFIQDQIEKLL